MKKMFFALSMFAVIFASCKKDNKDEPLTPTKENLTGTYKLTAFSAISNGSAIDLMMYMDA